MGGGITFASKIKRARIPYAYIYSKNMVRYMRTQPKIKKYCELLLENEAPVCAGVQVHV